MKQTTEIFNHPAELKLNKLTWDRCNRIPMKVYLWTRENILTAIKERQTDVTRWDLYAYHPNVVMFLD